MCNTPCQRPLLYIYIYIWETHYTPSIHPLSNPFCQVTPSDFNANANRMQITSRSRPASHDTHIHTFKLFNYSYTHIHINPRDGPNGMARRLLMVDLHNTIIPVYMQCISGGILHTLLCTKSNYRQSVTLTHINASHRLGTYFMLTGLCYRRTMPENLVNGINIIYRETCLVFLSIFVNGHK